MWSQGFVKSRPRPTPYPPWVNGACADSIQTYVSIPNAMSTLLVREKEALLIHQQHMSGPLRNTLFRICAVGSPISQSSSRCGFVVSNPAWKRPQSPRVQGTVTFKASLHITRSSSRLTRAGWLCTPHVNRQYDRPHIVCCGQTRWLAYSPSSYITKGGRGSSRRFCLHPL